MLRAGTCSLIASDLANVAQARHWLRRFCRDRLDFVAAEGDFYPLQLAVIETVTNIMKHAYHGAADQFIRMEADLFDDRIEVRFFYWGEPFDLPAIERAPFDGPQEGHMGLRLIFLCVDAVHCGRAPRGENWICLTKKWQSDTQGENGRGITA